MEDLAGREDKRARIAAAQAKTGVERAERKMEAAGGGQFRQRKDFMETLDLRFGRGHDKHIIAVGNRVELVADASDVAAKALDRLERQLAMHTGRAGLNFGSCCDGKPATLGQNRGNGVKASRFFDPQ